MQASPDHATYEAILASISNRARVAFACVCAERVFHIYANAPQDVVELDPAAMRDGLAAAWRFVEGHVFDPGELEEIGASAIQATPDSADYPKSLSVHYAACAITNAVVAPRVPVGAAAAAVNALDALRCYYGEDPTRGLIPSEVVRTEHEFHKKLGTHLRMTKDSDLTRDSLEAFLIE